MNYGDKYIRRFSAVTNSELSSAGKTWLQKARYNLQSLMEQGLRNNPNIELNNSKFQQFAFSSHVPAYVNAGILGLDFLDKTYILTTPDIKDLLTPLGIQQVKTIADLQTRYYIQNPSAALNHLSKLPYQLPSIERALGNKAEKELLEPLYPIILK